MPVPSRDGARREFIVNANVSQAEGKQGDGPRESRRVLERTFRSLFIDGLDGSLHTPQLHAGKKAQLCRKARATGLRYPDVDRFRNGDSEALGYLHKKLQNTAPPWWEDVQLKLYPRTSYPSTVGCMSPKHWYVSAYALNRQIVC